MSYPFYGRIVLAFILLYLIPTPSAVFADVAITGTFAIRPPIPDTSMVNPNSFNVLKPTGTASDKAMLQAAFTTSAARPVWLSVGTYEVCSEGLSLPFDGKVFGPSTGSSWNEFGNNAWPNGAVITCSSTFAFSDGDVGFIQMHDRSTITGVGFKGKISGGPSCIDARGAMAIVVRHNQFYGCNYSINRYADGGNAHGNATVNSQLALIDDNFSAGGQAGFYRGGCTGGAFVSDERIINNNSFFDGASGNGFIDLTCVYESQIANNRIEDSGTPPAIYISGGCCHLITGNYLDRITHGVMIQDSSEITISANRFGTYGGGGQPAITFGGANFTISVGPNFYDSSSPAFQANGGATITGGQFMGSGSYYDAFTEILISPLFQTVKAPGFSNIVLTGSAFAAPDLSSHPNVIMSLLPAPCPCSIPNPANSSDGINGVIAIAQSELGADTVTWGTNYVGTTPTLSATPGDTDYIPYVVAGNKVVRQPKSTVPAPANLLSGGTGMTSGWSVSATTLTNAVGTDPTGGAAASALKENSATSQHYVNQSFSGGNDVTCSVYIHAGTSGTRNLVTQVWDGTFTNAAWITFDQTGVYVTAGTRSAGTISGGFSVSVGGGWYKVGATYSLTTPAAFIFFALDNGSGTFQPSYAGNNVSNVWLWGPNCH